MPNNPTNESLILCLFQSGLANQQNELHQAGGCTCSQFVRDSGLFLIRFTCVINPDAIDNAKLLAVTTALKLRLERTLPNVECGRFFAGYSLAMLN